MNTDPWFAETHCATRPLPREYLQRLITHVLAANRMAVLCSIGASGPIGTPVEYFPEKTTVYVLPQPESTELGTLERDSRACLAVRDETSGEEGVRSVQLFGEASIIRPGTAAHAHAMTICRWQDRAPPLGRSPAQPPPMVLFCIAAERIIYTEPALSWNDFSPRQVWNP